MNSLADSLVWEHPQQDRLRLNSIIFFIAFLWSAGTGLSSKLKGRARIAYTACCIHAIAGTSYFLMSNNYVPLVPTSKGRPLFIARLFEWMVTVPMLLSLIAWLVDPDSRRVNQLRGLQFFCLVTGGIGPILRFPFNWISYCYSCYLQVLVLSTLHRLFQGMKRKLPSSYDRRLIGLLHYTILTIFSVYAIFWLFAAELDLVSIATEANVYATLDISTKVILTSVLSNLTGAAYDYDFEAFPQYFRSLFSSIQVPAFGLNKEGSVVVWNSDMEALTGCSAGSVLFLKFNRCPAFTKAGHAAISTALSFPLLPLPSSQNIQTNVKPEITIDLVRQSNSPETKALFYVLRNGGGQPALPETFFIDARSNPRGAEQAYLELSRCLAGAKGGREGGRGGQIGSTSSLTSKDKMGFVSDSSSRNSSSSGQTGGGSVGGGLASRLS